MLSTNRKFGITGLAAVIAASMSFSALANNDRDRDRDRGDKDHIVKVAQDNDNFSTFASAIEAAGMERALDKNGNYTVFAPTNDAFDALPDGALDELMDDPDRLRNILSYHVVDEKIESSDISSNGTTVSTMGGGELRVMESQGQVMVDVATVTYADIEASNGVIHGIDTVIIPAEYAELAAR